MKKHTIVKSFSLLLLWTFILTGSESLGATAANYVAQPPFITSGAPPLVMLVMGRDHKLYYEAYNDASDLDDDGEVDYRYKPEGINYYGYFDNYKCYTYNSSKKRFEPNSPTTNGKKCESTTAADWSGDFLNYLTMSRMDTMRKVLYGGYRSTDTAGETVLERVYIPQDAHSWGKEYTGTTVDGYDIADYAPLAVPAFGKRHFFASTTRTSATSPPLLIYVLNQSNRIWDWVTREAPQVQVKSGEVPLEVRVKVCDTAKGREPNCQGYPDGNYKPIGILQRHGETLWDATLGAYEKPKMYFGLMTGSYAKNTSGGVLRKKMGNISDEIETNTTGIFKTSVNGIIQTINKLRIFGYSYADKNYNLNCGWITNGPMTEGQCRDWGNPIGEIMYETERYFAGKKGPTGIFDYSGTTDDAALTLPKATWNNPYNTADGGFESCAKPFMLVLSDINPSFDSNQLPGVNSNFVPGLTSDLTGLADDQGVAKPFDVSAAATTISTVEGITTGKKFIGQSGATFNGVCSEKDVTGLGSIRGLCPEEPTKQGSYYSASVSYYGHTTDLQPAVAGEQKVTTYAVGLASPLPRIELKVGPDKRLVTLVPFGKTIGENGNSHLWPYSPTNTIVDFYVEKLTETYGRFNINYEDVEQGADHDMDAIVQYEYQLIKADGTNAATPGEAAKVKITLTSGAASGGYIQHLGYIISGTTADGPYLEVKDSDTPTDLLSPFDTPQAPATMLPLIATRIFEPSPAGGATATQLLPNPLWYAAKWGAYDEKDTVVGPNLVDEYDKDHDGVPDTYFYVTNPLKLEEQLNKSFADILRRTSSATAASVISGSRSGEGAVYQSIFYPEFNDEATTRHTVTWAGSVHASFVDDLARMREDTNQNGILDTSDKIFAFRKTGSGTTVNDKFDIVGAVAEVTTVTLPAAASLTGRYFVLNNVDEPFYVWFNVAGTGTDPRPSSTMTGISVALTATTDDAFVVATKTAAALNAYGAFIVPTPTTSTITITNATPGGTPDATAGDSGATIAISQQGAGETTTSAATEDIKYLWNSNRYLNTLTDAAVAKQRDYSSTTPGRYIFTFIDANKNKIADSDEQIEFISTRQTPFVATALPSVSDLIDPSTIYPYIPVHSDSEALPSYVSATGVDRNDFLQNQTKRVINYIRGQDQGATVLTGGTIPAFRSRKLDVDNDGTLETWRLGDIVHSSPTVVNKPFEANHLLYKDATYATFAAHYANRRTVVYMGANDGMMHAFNGGFFEDRFDVFPAVHDYKNDVQFLTQPKDKNGAVLTAGFAAHPLGAELWAYVPYNLLPHLYWLTDPNYSHVYYADLKPRMFEAKIFTPEAVCTTDPNDSGCIHPGGWGTVLVGGMRFGGGKISVDMDRTDGDFSSGDRRTMTSSYYILDVTNPEAPPTVLGELSFPHLGYTTSYPTVASFKDKVETSTSPNKWYLIFGSGPAEADGSPGSNPVLITDPGTSLSEGISKQPAKLYVVDLVELATNKVLKTIDTSGASSSELPYYYQNFTGDNNAFISDPIAVDTNLDYKAEAVYFGTVSYGPATDPKWGGKLRRIVMKNEGDPKGIRPWNGESVLMDLESSQHQPITAAPAVGLDPSGNTWVFFGTGRYLVRDDSTITDQQTYYGIKEPRIASATNSDILENSYATVSRTDLFNSTTVEVNAATHLVSGGVKPDGTAWTNATWATFLADTNAAGGWYYNFTHSGERNVGQAALYADLLTFTSYIPSDDVCAYEGSSFLYAFNYLTGSAPFDAAIADTANPNPTNNLKMIFLGTGLVSKPSIHVGRNDGSTVFVQTSDGSIVTLKEENPGQTKSGKTSWQCR